MFSKSKPMHESAAMREPNPNRDAAGGAGATFSVIGRDVVISGDVQAGIDLHIDGQISGSVECASLVQGESSRIEGAIKAETARIAGNVEGPVNVNDLIIENGARIAGDVCYETLSVQEGARIEGRFTPKTAAAKHMERQAAIAAEAEKGRSRSGAPTKKEPEDEAEVASSPAKLELAAGGKAA